MSPADPAPIGAGIESLVQELTALGDSPARAQAQELVHLLMSLYGAGLSRMLDVVRTEGGESEAVLERFATDPLLASLLVLHDLHPHSIEVRPQRALTGLQPHLPASTHVTPVAVDPREPASALADASPDRRSPGGGRSADTLREDGSSADWSAEKELL